MWSRGHNFGVIFCFIYYILFFKFRPSDVEEDIQGKVGGSFLQ